MYTAEAPAQLLFTTGVPGPADTVHKAAEAAVAVPDNGNAADRTRQEQAHAGPREVMLGDGALPLGIEMALKLMLPGEQSIVDLHPDYGFATCVPGMHPELPREDTLRVHLQLVDYARDSHPEAMDTEQVRTAQMRPCCAAAQHQNFRAPAQSFHLVCSWCMHLAS